LQPRSERFGKSEVGLTHAQIASRQLPLFEFCLPTGAKVVPDGPDWLHEMKYDGYRLRVDRDGDRVRPARWP
jgi:ATP-dependent DNA ligase